MTWPRLQTDIQKHLDDCALFNPAQLDTWKKMDPELLVPVLIGELKTAISYLSAVTAQTDVLAEISGN